MKKSIYYIIILLVTIFPYSVNARWCDNIGAVCFDDVGGTTVYCVTPLGADCQPAGWSYLIGGVYYNALESMGGVGENGANINGIRMNWSYYMSEFNPSMDLSSSSNCSNSNINTEVKLTEIPYDQKDEDFIKKEGNEKIKFVRRFNLNITASSDDGDLDGFTFTLNVSFKDNENKYFRLLGNYSNIDISNSIKSRGYYEKEIIVYSNDLIKDTSKLVLIATVQPKTSCSKYIFAMADCTKDGRNGQWYIGEVSEMDSDITPVYDEKSINVSKSCQYKIITDEETGEETPIYRFHIVEPGKENADNQDVDVITYMKKGCCSTVQPKFFNRNTPEGQEALKVYRDECLDKSVVSYENSCGAENCNSDQVVKSFSESFVLQPTIEKLKKLYNLDNMDLKNINVSENDKKLAPYYNESLSNKYCKVITSEDNLIYYPTTAVATSGRFFVFQDYNNDECKLGNSSSCFRQPYVEGTIHVYVRTDYQKWLNDKNDAENEKSRLNCDNIENANLLDSSRCGELVKKIKDLDNYKTQCENIANFNYNLEPKIKFYYEQDYSDGNSKSKKVEEINMVSNDTTVKYWPKITENAVKKSENKLYSFENGDKYEATYKKVVYYRPEIYTYSLLPSGLIATTNEFQGIATRFEKGISVGYVYNISTTAYVGIYNTWFDISNLGNGGENSLLTTYVIKEYKEASKRDFEGKNTDKMCNNKEWTDENKKCIINYDDLIIPGKENDATSLMFRSQCKYCIEEGAFQRECDACDELDPKFVFRNVSLSNITPNTEEGERKNEGTNWVDDKGKTAKSDIEKVSGKGIAVADIKDSDKELLNNNKNAAIKTLESNEKTNIVFTADEGNTNYIYANDKDYLEYDITLTSKDMALIKKNNKKISYDYAKISICSESGADRDYCYTCNQDGKECESTFIDAYGDQTVTKDTRKRKWKYYFYNPDTKTSTFIKGKMRDISEFENGRYPDPENQQGWLNTYKNWP